LKKVPIFIGIAVVITVVAFYFLQSETIVENPELLHIGRVASYSNGEGTEITESVDLNKLADILSRYQRGRIPKSFNSYSLSEIRYQINGAYGNDSLHILVGDLNIVYSGRTNGGFEIKNSRMLLAEIDALIKP
jgi:hypothetical protein